MIENNAGKQYANLQGGKCRTTSMLVNFLSGRLGRPSFVMFANSYGVNKYSYYCWVQAYQIFKKHIRKCLHTSEQHPKCDRLLDFLGFSMEYKAIGPSQEWDLSSLHDRKFRNLKQSQSSNSCPWKASLTSPPVAEGWTRCKQKLLSLPLSSLWIRRGDESQSTWS